ncbi:hypothetical protein ACX93W_21660 [Paenibacillus sp. CAU 1782]
MIQNIIQFFDSNFFQTFIILIVGLFAFISYKVVKNDERRNAASIVLMEIRSIEDELNRLKDAKDLYATRPVISSNEWKTYKHILISELDYDEYTSIENLYRMASNIEQERQLYREHIEITIKEKARAFQEHASLIATQLWDKEKREYDERINKVAALFFPTTPEFKGRFPKELLEKLLNDYYPVTTTTAGQKIKFIAKKQRVYSFFRKNM